jgi:hypothetical protein
MKLKIMSTIGILTFVAATAAHAQSVTVDVSLTPAGNFKAETNQVTGTAYKSGDGYTAENIVVDIRNLKTGVDLRDKHTRKHLGVPQYSSVKLIKASGKGGKGEATIQVMDKTEKVNGTYKVNGNKLDAVFKMTLSGVGIKDVAYMGIGVEDSVTVHVTVPIKEGAPVKVAPAASAKGKTSAQSQSAAQPRVPASASHPATKVVNKKKTGNN